MATPRSTAESVLFTSYNMLDLFAGEGPRVQEHYALVVEAIRALGSDVLAVQEVRAPDEETAGKRLSQLASDTDMECLVPEADAGQSRPALAFGSHGYHCGLLWRQGITPVPGSLRCRSQDLWHSLAVVSLDVGGPRVRHASFHATPFGRTMREVQNELVVATLARPQGRQPTLVGADWNGESADRVPNGKPGQWRLYEPRDPFEGVAWFGDMVHQCVWDYDRRGRRRHLVDRRAGEVLWAGELLDAAALLGADWQATTGHYPRDPYGTRGVHRRIDQIRVTPEVKSALRAYRVTDTNLTRRASDHLPVTVEYLPSVIAGQPAPRPPG